MTHLSKTLFRTCVALVLLVEICAINAVSADPGVWTAAGPMEYDRYWFTATTLLNGRVLVTGGYSYESYDLKTAELFDGATSSWRETGSMRFARYSHTATLLADGRVLVAAGYNGDDMSSAEIYDPARHRWNTTGPLNVAREEHAATRLQDGRVLVVGGYASQVGSTPSTEAYDPATGSWTVQGNLHDGRWWPTATTLDDGRVLVTGGGSVYRAYKRPSQNLLRPTRTRGNSRPRTVGGRFPTRLVLTDVGGTLVARLYRH